MAAERRVRVFVDDAARGHFPPVCAVTGDPSDGWVTLRTPVGGPRVSFPLAVLLLLVGPVGWAAYLLLCAFEGGRETFEVEVPCTEAAHDAHLALRRRRWKGGALVAAGLLGLPLSAAVTPGGGTLATATLLLFACGAVAAVGVVAVLVASWQLGHRLPRVELDASRRWVTLSNVAPAFVAAVAADQAARARDRRVT